MWINTFSVKSKHLPCPSQVFCKRMGNVKINQVNFVLQPIHQLTVDTKKSSRRAATHSQINIGIRAAASFSQRPKQKHFRATTVFQNFDGALDVGLKSFRDFNFGGDHKLLNQ